MPLDYARVLIGRLLLLEYDEAFGGVTTIASAHQTRCIRDVVVDGGAIDPKLDGNLLRCAPRVYQL